MTITAKERPSLFRDDMVRAILAGTKTQTRRLIKLREFQASKTPGFDVTFRDRKGRWNDYSTADLIAKKCPYGAPGDRIWVREAWRPAQIDGRAWYRADCDDGTGEPRPPGTQWRPSIFMPRRASRITLEIVSVRVERLTQISDEDAFAEGVIQNRGDETWYAGKAAGIFRDVFRRMHELDMSADPWLWVIEFRTVRA